MQISNQNNSFKKASNMNNSSANKNSSDHLYYNQQQNQTNSAMQPKKIVVSSKNFINSDIAIELQQMGFTVKETNNKLADFIFPTLGSYCFRIVDASDWDSNEQIGISSFCHSFSKAAVIVLGNNTNNVLDVLTQCQISVRKTALLIACYDGKSTARFMVNLCEQKMKRSEKAFRQQIEEQAKSSKVIQSLWKQLAIGELPNGKSIAEMISGNSNSNTIAQYFAQDSVL